MVIPGIEGDDNLAIPPLAEGDPVAVVCILKEGHDHAGERVAVPKGVRDTVLPPAVDLGDDQNVVEEEYLPLVLACDRCWLELNHSADQRAGMAGLGLKPGPARPGIQGCQQRIWIYPLLNNFSQKMSNFAHSLENFPVFTPFLAIFEPN